MWFGKKFKRREIKKDPDFDLSRKTYLERTKAEKEILNYNENRMIYTNAIYKS